VATLSTTITVTILVCFAWLAFVLGFLALGSASFGIAQVLAIFFLAGILAIAGIAALWVRWLLRG
jgi:hypothetical protein